MTTEKTDPLLARLETIGADYDIETRAMTELRALLADAVIEAIESDIMAIPDHRGAVYKRFGVAPPASEGER